MKALSFFILFAILQTACSSETHFLISPLEWITAEMDKKSIELHLPFSKSSSVNKGHYIRLSDIKESTYKETGIEDIHLFFKKKSGKAYLNAVQLVFKKSATKEKQLKKLLNSRYKKIKPLKWKTKNNFVVDYDARNPVQIKITYDAQR